MENRKVKIFSLYTVASRMNVDGWSLEEIRRWLGHTSKETTLKYIFNPYRQDEMKEKRKKTSILQNNKNCLQNNDSF